jgi:hypothetical protein
MAAPKEKKLEFEPDAWSRFERAVDIVAKSPPLHRQRPKKRKRPKKRPVNLKISLHASAAVSALEKLSSLLPRLKNFEPGRVDLFQFLAEGGIIEFHTNPTALAGHVRVVAKPSDSFNVLVAAARAGNIDIGAVEKLLGHNCPP